MRALQIILVVLAMTAAVAEWTGGIGRRGLKFVSEEILLTVEESDGPALLVDGTYHYRFEGWVPTEVSLRGPYPTGADVLGTTVLWVDQDGQSLPFQSDGQAALVRARFKPGEASTVRMRYRQRLATRAAGYIVTTTRLWRRPLEEASFRLALPPGCALESASEPLSLTALSARRTAFFPERDVTFRWACQR